jgi:hypothetical protein
MHTDASSYVYLTAQKQPGCEQWQCLSYTRIKTEGSFKQLAVLHNMPLISARQRLRTLSKRGMLLEDISDTTTCSKALYEWSSEEGTLDR